VRAHTVIGFLADPKYGGNRDFAGWRVSGYPGPRHHRGGYTAEQMAGTAPVQTVWGDEQ
jgi:gluconate 2-dehydrogenase gamma chain